jgi:hypothetical protein
MAQSSIGQASGHNYTTSATALKYRTKNSGNPLQHDDVDANFDILRKAVNGLVTDHGTQAGQITTLTQADTALGNRITNITNGTTALPMTNITGLATALAGKVDDGQVLTNVPSGAVFTDTVYNLPVAATAIGGVKEGGDIDIDSSGNMTVKANAIGAAEIANDSITSAQIANDAIGADQIADGAIDATKISTTVNLGGGGASGFQRAATMCSPSVLTGTNGQQWVYTVNYGGGSGGYHMTMFDIDGTFIGHLFPSSAGGNSSAPSWPYHHTAGWAATWPQTWIDGSKGLNSGYAWMWVKHSGSYLFSMKLSLTTGHPYTNHGIDRNPGNQAAGDYWATEGVHAAGGNAFGDHWNIIGQDVGNMICTFGYESSAQNYANGVQSYVMAKGSYNSPYASYSYTGVTKYMPQCSAGLNGSLNGTQHNQSYIMVAGINPTSGRVYLHRKGCADVMTVMQLSQANGTGPSRWYRAWASMLKTAPDQPNTGTYKLNYVTQFAIPDAINTEGGNQTTSYQVQFTTPTTANPDSVPTYLTRGGHWGSWNYGGAQIIPWQSSWET